MTENTDNYDAAIDENPPMPLSEKTNKAISNLKTAYDALNDKAPDGEEQVRNALQYLRGVKGREAEEKEMREVASGVLDAGDDDTAVEKALGRNIVKCSFGAKRTDRRAMMWCKGFKGKLLMKGGVFLFGGEGGVGKSTYLYGMLHAMACGEEGFGGMEWDVDDWRTADDRGVNVVFASCEDYEDDLLILLDKMQNNYIKEYEKKLKKRQESQARVREMTGAAAEDVEVDESYKTAALKKIYLANIVHRQIFGMRKTDQYSPKELGPLELWYNFWNSVEQIKPALVVIDPVAFAFGGNINSMEDTSAFIAAISRKARELDTCVILAAHINKEGIKKRGNTSDSTAMFGSVGLVNAVRAVAIMEHVDDDPDSMERKITITKANKAKRNIQCIVTAVPVGFDDDNNLDNEVISFTAGDWEKRFKKEGEEGNVGGTGGKKEDAPVQGTEVEVPAQDTEVEVPAQDTEAEVPVQDTEADAPVQGMDAETKRNADWDALKDYPNEK